MSPLKSVQPSSEVASPFAQACETPTEQQIASAQMLLRSVLELPQQTELFDLDARSLSRMLYTNIVPLWLLILQRLGGDKTLDETAARLISHGLDLWPDDQSVRQVWGSENTRASASARTRLLHQHIRDTSERICHHLSEMSPGVLDGRSVFVIDGTTIILPSTAALRKAYPPATHQRGESANPVAQLMVAADLQTSCVLSPQIDPIYGENNVGEAEQARRIALKLPEKSIILADADLGIYSVAYQSVAAGHDIVFRLSHTGFKALCRGAEMIAEGPSHKTYHHLWSPSDKDRKTNPDLPKDAAIEVVLHDVKLGEGSSLYLASTLKLDADMTARLYNRRDDIAFDIHDLKGAMNVEDIYVRGVNLLEDELHTSIAAYNLTIQFRQQAAKVAKVAPRKLSFTGIWLSFTYSLVLQSSRSFEEWTTRFDATLRSAAYRKLPNRSNRRS
jgi:hypothetical protein